MNNNNACKMLCICLALGEEPIHSFIHSFFQQVIVAYLPCVLGDEDLVENKRCLFSRSLYCSEGKIIKPYKRTWKIRERFPEWSAMMWFIFKGDCSGAMKRTDSRTPKWRLFLSSKQVTVVAWTKVITADLVRNGWICNILLKHSQWDLLVDLLYG